MNIKRFCEHRWTQNFLLWKKDTQKNLVNALTGWCLCPNCQNLLNKRKTQTRAVHLSHLQGFEGRARLRLCFTICFPQPQALTVTASGWCVAQLVTSRVAAWCVCSHVGKGEKESNVHCPKKRSSSSSESVLLGEGGVASQCGTVGMAISPQAGSWGIVRRRQPW